MRIYTSTCLLLMPMIIAQVMMLWKCNVLTQSSFANLQILNSFQPVWTALKRLSTFIRSIVMVLSWRKSIYRTILNLLLLTISIILIENCKGKACSAENFFDSSTGKLFHLCRRFVRYVTSISQLTASIIAPDEYFILFLTDCNSEESSYL